MQLWSFFQHLAQAALIPLESLAILFVALLSGSFLTLKLSIRFCQRYNFLAYPQKDRWHQTPTPKLGGISFVIPTLFSFLFFPLFTDLHSKVILALFAGGVITFSGGLIDDIYTLSPRWKITGQLIPALLAVSLGVSLQLTPWPFLNIGMTLFLILFITNAFNLIDNMDGLASGLALSSLLLFLLASLRHLYTHEPLLPNTLATPQFDINIFTVTASTLSLAPFLIFYLYNKKPAKLFMGDGGSQFLGFIFATLAILASPQSATSSLQSLMAYLGFFVVPALDTTFVSINRPLRGRNILQGGKDHLSHHLVSHCGLSESAAVNLLIGFNFFAGLLILYWTH